MDNFVTFSSPNTFTVKITPKCWNGTVEYSLDKTTWKTYTNETITAANGGESFLVFFRGKNNTHFATSSDNYSKFTFTGSDITGSGNLRDLLDYNKDEFDDWDLNDYEIDSYAFYKMFEGCTALIGGPDIRAIDPMPSYACAYMYSGCTSLYKTPKLLSIDISSHSYDHMFYGCTNIFVIQGLPGLTLGESCYESMFEGCTGLVKPCKLPSFSLATSCYKKMFKGCTLLEDLPYLYATTLANSCYESMFEGCTSIKLSSSRTGNYIRKVRVPQAGTATVGTDSLKNMFSSTSGTWTGAPTSGTTYYMEQEAAIRFVSRYPFDFGARTPYGTLLSMEYSTDKSTWTTYNHNARERVYPAKTGNLYNLWIRGTIPAYDVSDRLFLDGKDVHTIGNFEALVNYSNYKNGTELAAAKYYFSNLFIFSKFITGPDFISTTCLASFNSTFKDCDQLIEAPELYGNIDPASIDPSNTGSYSNAFERCTNLIIPPIILPAEVGTNSEFMYMFNKDMNLVIPPKFNLSSVGEYTFSYSFADCWNLKTIPDLTATTVGNYGYNWTFIYCHSLKDLSSKTLPATTIGNSSYYSMFNFCTNLKKPPAIAVTSITGNSGMNSMFSQCWSLEEAPTLNAINVNNVSNAFSSMFSNCTSLKTVQSTLSISNVGTYTFYNMFYGCANLTSIPSFTISTIPERCYYAMFQACTSLVDASNITITATEVGNYGLSNLFNGCHSLKVLPDISSITTVGTYGMSYIFSDCHSLTTQVDLSNITSLGTYGLSNAFSKCQSLVNPPIMPSVSSIPDHGYSSMFYGCTSLKTAPVLPATTIGTYGYNYMFYGCKSLRTPPALPATNLSNYCYYYMFVSCWDLYSIPELPATTLPNYCYGYMFSSASGLMISDTQTGDYTVPIRIPSSGTGTVGTNSLIGMFNNTAGTWTGTPTVNTTYYLRQLYTLSFNSMGGSEVESISGISKGLLDLPCPTKQGYIFDGWYTDTTYETRFLSSTALEGNTTVYAKWLEAPTFDEIKNTALCFTSLSGNNFTMSICGHMWNGYLMYSLDGINWVGYTENTEVTTTNSKIYWMGRHNTYISRSEMNPTFLFGSERIKISGRLKSLLNWWDVVHEGSYSFSNYWANGLFRYSPNIVESSDILYGNLADYCYFYLFYFCFNLEKVQSELYASELRKGCYSYMFYNCKKLKKAPKLNSTSIRSDATSTMYYMFANSGLVTLPRDFVSVNAIYDSGLDSAFMSCIKLRESCNLPATTLGVKAYRYAFSSCRRMEKGPDELPALSVPDEAYSDMFNTSRIKEAPKIYATSVGNKGCYNAFYNCDFLTGTGELKFTTFTGTENCKKMFYNCKSLERITSRLPALTLTESCYEEMFYGCTSLTLCPEILATTVAKKCCLRMFYLCGLTRLCKLYATTLAESCYQSMFENNNIYIGNRSTQAHLYEWRIPATGTGTAATDATTNMINNNVGWSYEIKTPALNTTYYVGNNVETRVDYQTIPYVKVNGQWKKASKVYVKVNGTWKEGKPYQDCDGHITNWVYV